MKTPEQFEKECRTVVQFLGYLAHEYRWAYGVAHSKQVGTNALGVRIKTSDPPDPTFSGMNGHHKLRDVLEEACTNISETRRHVQDDVHDVRRALFKDEVPHGPLFDALRNPRTATRADKREAREAQMRRRERRESIA